MAKFSRLGACLKTDVILILAVLAAVRPCYGEGRLYDTKYNWSGLARSITSSSKTEYERAHDIYAWITENIAYDTSYSIRSADETYEKRRGVCQGYCELFYRIAEAAGLRCDVVSGKSKDYDCAVDDKGHAWIFVYTGGGSGILMDPTWGAGSVSGGRFTRKPSDDWFHVKPEWFIFSHFPDDRRYQLLSRPISFDTFRRIGYYDPSLSAYGYEGKDILDAELSGRKPDMPKFSDKAIELKTSGIRVPLQRVLRVGTTYKFSVTPKGDARFMIVSGQDFESNWVRTGRQAYIRFMPAAAGPLVVAAEADDYRYMHLVEYTVAEPTAEETEQLERECPLRSPALTGLKNYHRLTLERWGMDPRRLLTAVKREGVKVLPTFYAQPGCRVVDVPVNGELKAGRTYTFRFTPGKGNDFAGINGEKWAKKWTRNSDGTISLTVTPTTGGTLKISARTGNGDSYSPFLQYTVR